MKKLVLLICVLLVNANDLLAQCAMCRATLENNVSNGEIGVAARINFGIMYLFVMPYLLVAVVGFLWYRKTRSNKKHAKKAYLAH
ncbi:MAG: hypothetical protein AAFX87_18280 [Bacteroidota bacterium]